MLFTFDEKLYLDSPAQGLGALWAVRGHQAQLAGLRPSAGGALRGESPGLARADLALLGLVRELVIDASDVHVQDHVLVPPRPPLKGVANGVRVELERGDVRLDEAAAREDAASAWIVERRAGSRCLAERVRPGGAGPGDVLDLCGRSLSSSEEAGQSHPERKRPLTHRHLLPLVRPLPVRWTGSHIGRMVGLTTAPAPRGLRQRER